MEHRQTEIGSNEKIIDILYSLEDARALAAEIRGDEAENLHRYRDHGGEGGGGAIWAVSCATFR